MSHISPRVCAFRYVELEGSEAWHMKASLVTQAEGSKYQITEAQLGGRLTRHDLSIQQVTLFHCSRRIADKTPAARLA